MQIEHKGFNEQYLFFLADRYYLHLHKYFIRISLTITITHKNNNLEITQKQIKENTNSRQ